MTITCTNLVNIKTNYEPTRPTWNPYQPDLQCLRQMDRAAGSELQPLCRTLYPGNRRQPHAKAYRRRVESAQTDRFRRMQNPCRTRVDWMAVRRTGPARTVAVADRKRQSPCRTFNRKRAGIQRQSICHIRRQAHNSAICRFGCTGGSDGKNNLRK